VPGGAIWLCPGQGTQQVGMAKDLAERFPAARTVLEAIDDALDFALSRIMFEGPEADLTATQNAQPAILAHSAAVHAVVRERVNLPVAAAGHSLGEYSAYVAAGALDAPAAAKLVRRRGELMHQAGTQRPGTMAVILGLDTAAVEAACRDASRDGAIAVAANLNGPDQTVISGDPDAVARAGVGCKERGAKRVMPLNVSGAFHSPLMRSAAGPLQVALQQAPLRDPAFPVVANATAELVTRADRARRLLVDQLTAPVRWVACMEHAARVGGSEARWIEIGPGRALAGLLRRIAPGASVVSLGTAPQVEQFLEAA